MTNSRFAFGRNWKEFSRVIDESRVSAAVDGLKQLLQESRLDGRSFLDIGSGSGLSSVAAARLGARVRAFDYDEDSVAATRDNLRRFVSEAPVEVGQGSAIDADYMASLGQFDVVYSWGVLHHTGAMWTGLELAAEAVAPDGKLAIAIYNDQGGASRRWLIVKRLYVTGGPIRRGFLLVLFALFFEGRAALNRLLRLENPLPFQAWRQRRQTRGMSMWHDLVDWVGGYPFEVAKPEEIFEFFHVRGFILNGLTTCAGGLGCNEFLFVRAAAPAK